MSEAPKTGTEPVHVTALDGVRGFAILAIAVLHLSFISRWVPGAELPRSLLNTVYFALDFLFFVSGFVIFLPVVVKGTLGDVRAFFLRRYARIAPAFYVSLIVLLVFWPLFVGSQGENFPPRDAGTLLGHLFFVHMEIALPYHDFVPGFEINGPLWTLSIDIVFYLLLPLVALRYLRHPLIGLALAIAITLGWRIALDPGHDFLAHAIHPSDRYLAWHQAPLFVADFAFGMTGAWAWAALARRPDRRRVQQLALPVYALSFLGLIALLWAVGADLTSSREPFVIGGARFQQSLAATVAVPALFSVFAVSAALAPAWAQWPLTNPVSRWLGDVSYSVYLYHSLVFEFLVLNFGFPRGDFEDFLLMGAVGLPLTLLVGWASYALVERPGRRWARRFARRWTRAAPSPAAAAAP